MKTMLGLRMARIDRGPYVPVPGHSQAVPPPLLGAHTCFAFGTLTSAPARFNCQIQNCRHADEGLHLPSRLGTPATPARNANFLRCNRDEWCGSFSAVEAIVFRREMTNHAWTTVRAAQYAGECMSHRWGTHLAGSTQQLHDSIIRLRE